MNFIGLTIKVKEAKNKTLLGVEGKVIDETKNTLVVETAKGTKTLLKRGVVFYVKEKGMVIKGKDIMEKPEERIRR